jgi:hypothetical protein
MVEATTILPRQCKPLNMREPEAASDCPGSLTTANQSGDKSAMAANILDNYGLGANLKNAAQSEGH